MIEEVPKEEKPLSDDELWGTRVPKSPVCAKGGLWPYPCSGRLELQRYGWMKGSFLCEEHRDYANRHPPIDHPPNKVPDRVIDAPIPDDLKRQVGEHGYPNCDCDLYDEGDPECELTTPYETHHAYLARLRGLIAQLEAEKQGAWNLLRRYRKEHYPRFDSYHCGGYSNDSGPVGLCSICKATDGALSKPPAAKQGEPS